jgi:hypothetical protein
MRESVRPYANFCGVLGIFLCFASHQFRCLGYPAFQKYTSILYRPGYVHSHRVDKFQKALYPRWPRIKEQTVLILITHWNSIFQWFILPVSDATNPMQSKNVLHDYIVLLSFIYSWSVIFRLQWIHTGYERRTKKYLIINSHLNNAAFFISSHFRSLGCAAFQKYTAILYSPSDAYSHGVDKFQKALYPRWPRIEEQTVLIIIRHWNSIFQWLILPISDATNPMQSKNVLHDYIVLLMFIYTWSVIFRLQWIHTGYECRIKKDIIINSHLNNEAFTHF